MQAKREKECLSLKSAKAPLRLRAGADIAFAIGRLISNPGVEIRVVDCLLAATAVAKNVPVSTFDQDFRKFGDVRVETE